ncbi:saccharopine dehydrogenase NADP-binding domain-containing protein [Dermacoccus sp. Tok2021]|uniref:saccharopine dehydrogenase NADP-binding domain-containing protein n=1 Tax=Dermacoccus sp. Tok2021 TaxID=2826873 RepID=UPI001CA64EDA|nr:saccharopine dehydrogenase NADP-binding domain-containing protein [Dermacoccus sp. Tok2021]MBZ4497900.1 saccharopine dehydrogenase NADP-binding domain-containing protein [Dermacoccus sp. Tok2021]
MSQSSTTDVAVLGAYGAVGQAALRAIANRRPETRVRLGGRNVARAEALLDELGLSGEAVGVDLADGESLAGFCRGSRVVLNCAGPSYVVQDRVAWAAVAASADYVDPGGDEPVFDALRRPGTFTGTAVLTAGMQPGLTGLLPKHLARSMSHPRSLTAYVGTMDRLTPAGAADYLLSMGGSYGEAQAAIRGGVRVERELEPRTDVTLPYFTGRVDAYPYLSFESGQLAASLGLERVDWFNVFEGGAHMMSCLSRLQGAMHGESDLAVAAEELTRAAALDLFGKSPFQLMLFEVTGAHHGSPVTRSLALRAHDTYAVTGLVSALAVLDVFAGRVGPGVHFASDVLDADAMLTQLRAEPAVNVLDISDRAILSAPTMEQGEL